MEALPLASFSRDSGGRAAAAICNGDEGGNKAAALMGADCGNKDNEGDKMGDSAGAAVAEGDLQIYKDRIIGWESAGYICR